MLRSVALLLCATALMLVTAPEACAHGGGNCRFPPFGPSPPPDPPPPPPPSYVPPITSGDWVHWYTLHRSDVERIKDAHYAFVGGGSLARLGAAATESRARRDVHARLDQDVLPPLLEALADDDAEVASAAAIALARTTRDPAHIDLLLGGLVLTRPQRVREASALALGLLQRTRPHEQFAAVDLDRVRAALFALVADGQATARARAYAAFALGLLAQQPTEPAGPARRREHSDRLFDLLATTREDGEVPVALLTAIGQQARDSISDSQREVLQGLVRRARLGDTRVRVELSVHAATALGRVGGPDDTDTLLATATSPASTAGLVAAAVLALGDLAPRIDGTRRARLAEDLLACLPEVRLTHVRSAHAGHLARLALARLAMVDIQDGGGEVLEPAGVGAFLLASASQAPAVTRPWGALALAWVAREIGDSSDVAAHGAFRARAVDVLRAGAQDTSLTPRDRSAFVLGLGIAGDEASRSWLRAIAVDAKEHTTTRAHAALAVGLVAYDRDPGTAAALVEVLRTTSDETLRAHGAVALVRLREPAGLDVLLEHLAAADTQVHQARLLRLLARVADGHAITPLVTLLRAPSTSSPLRAWVVTALGALAEHEFHPALARLSEGTDPRALGGFLRETTTIP